MTYSVVKTTVPERPTAVIPAVTSWAEYPQVWPELLHEVHEEVTYAGSGELRPGRNVMLYLNDVPHVEVGVLLERDADLGGHVVRSSLPAGEVAMTVHHGDYGRLGDAHDAVHKWCAAKELRLAGPRWEIYGHWTEDENSLETEIYYLLR